MGNDSDINGNKNIGIQGVTGSNINITTYNYDAIVPYPDKNIRKYLTRFPFLPPNFLGRESDLSKVHDRLFNGESLLLLVNGQGGIGKTSFAGKYWHKYHEEYSHLANLYVGDGITNAFLGLEDFLQISYPHEKPLPEAEDRLKKLILALHNLKKPCLIILDNANEKKELDTHIQLLQPCQNLHILLTSRLDSYNYAFSYQIKPLPKEAAFKMFKTHYKGASETDYADFCQLFDALEGNTLILELFAKNLNHFNNLYEQNYTLTDLQNDILNGLTALSKSRPVETFYQAGDTGLREEKAEDIILAMYDLSKLDRHEQALLSVFSVLPPENLPFGAIHELLPIENLSILLLSLVNRGWIEEDKTAKSFKCSPVVQEVVRHRNQEDLWRDCEEFVQQIMERLRLMYDSDSKALVYVYGDVEMLRYVRYGQSVIARAISNSNYINTENILILCERIGNYYQIKGDSDKLLEYCRLWNELAQKLNESDANNDDLKYNLAFSYEKLGEIYEGDREWDKALECYSLENDIFQRLHKEEPENQDYTNGLSISYGKLGGIYRKIRNFDKALECYKQDCKLCKKLQSQNPQNEIMYQNLAISYRNLGSVYESKKDFDKALEYYLLFHQLFKVLRDNASQNIDFQMDLAESYSKLSGVYRQKENNTLADTYIQMANEIWEKLYY